LRVARTARSLWQHRMALDRLLIAFSVVTVGVSQVLFNLILNNPEHFPTSGLFFIYVIAAVQLFPMLLVVGIDAAVSRLFGDRWVTRGWRTLLYLFVIVSVARQAQLLSVEPVDTWIRDLAGTYQLVWVVLGLAFVAAIWYGCRLLNSFFLYLAPLALVLTGIFVIQAGLFGTAWRDEAIAAVKVSDNSPAVDALQLPPIFIIMWDELEYGEMVKDGRIDAQFVPNFAALAEDSVWFPNAQTLSRDTDISIATFLTGTLPNSQGTFTAPTLFERLAKDYDLHLYEEKAVLARQFGCVNPNVKCRGELYVRSHFPLKAGKWAISQYLNLIVPARVFEAIGYSPSIYEPQISRILDDVRNSNGSGNLWYWHVILPHGPYIFNPDGTKHGPTGNGTENYRKQTQFVDMLLGRFVNMLKTEGLYDDSIFVVTTDHGLDVNCPCSIPLIIRAPDVTPKISNASYSHLDFVPTLLDLLGIPLTPDDRLAGESAFASGPKGLQGRD